MNRSVHLVTLVLLLLIPHSFVPAAAAQSVAARSLDAADAAYRAKDWARTAEMYAALARENPAQGAFWYRLATAEYSLKQYDAAIPHYQRAIEDGFNVGGCYYNIGCCHALAGRAKPAIDAIDLAIKNDLRDRERLLREDHDLDSLRGMPEFQKRILPDVDGMSRTEGWRTDLDYLTRRVAETHYDPWRNISRKEWDAEIARISKAVPKMKDHEITVALMVLMARLQDGHSGMFPPAEGANAFHALPIEFYDFPDGVYVRGATTAYADLVGKKLVRINDTPARGVFDRIATTVPRDNTQGIRWQAARHLGSVEALDAFGIIPDISGARVTVMDANGKETSMDVAAISRADHLNNPRTTDWVDMADQATAGKPLWRQHKDKNYWYEYLKDRDMVYMGFNNVLNQDNDASLPDFAGQVFDFLKANDVDILVIDVRTNHGGNNFLARNLMLDIISSDRINQHGHLFVITGRETFSACQNFCNWLDFDADVVFVGEPTGSKPNFVGEGNNVVLPYSGLIANASSRLWQNSVSEDQRPWIAPNVAADMSADDYRNNRDPAMEAIFAYLGARAEASQHGSPADN